MRLLLFCSMLLQFAFSSGSVQAQSRDTAHVFDTAWTSVVIVEDSLRLPENFDEQLLVDINALGHDTLPTLDFTMTAFTHSIYATTIVVPGGLYALGWGTDDHHMAATGMNVLLSELLAGLTTMTVKAIVRRNRPY